MKARTKEHIINIVSLGCSKNVVDSEVLMKQLDANGLKVVYNSDDSKADTVIINTCGFIKDAKEESIDTILRHVKAKENGILKQVYVMGCLSERYRNELKKEIRNVDAYFGSNNISEIVNTLGYDYKAHLTGERVLTTPSHYAYMKVSEGCDRHCAFCAIPLMRGRHRSKSLELLVEEAGKLAEKGVKELILIAQDLTYYGVDIYGRQKLAELLLRLSDIEGIAWIRLHYAYPAGFPKDVLQVMKNRTNICNYLDIPFQHINDRVLKNMRRGITGRQTRLLIEQIRNAVPDLTLRTTLMTGHPGEGEPEFEELVNFVEHVKFDRLGVFTYSEEDDTFGARNLKDDVPGEIKKQRADHIMELQEQISLSKNKLKEGKKMLVLIDRKENDYYVGRTEGDSPEVDNEVLVRSDLGMENGRFYTVMIDGSEAYDLYGRYPSGAGS
jgi:ribosomal protein S12 methylthiotransferase